MRGKCPNCQKLVMHVDIDTIEVKSGTRKFQGVTYNCPFCLTVLSVSLDPLLLHSQVLDQIKKKG